MAREDLIDLIAAVRAAIARLNESQIAEERTITRALAHLWSAHDELQLLTRERVAAQVSAIR